jgi:hypothetical protein
MLPPQVIITALGCYDFGLLELFVTEMTITFDSIPRHGTLLWGSKLDQPLQQQQDL